MDSHACDIYVAVSHVLAHVSSYVPSRHTRILGIRLRCSPTFPGATWYHHLFTSNWRLL